MTARPAVLLGLCASIVLQLGGLQWLRGAPLRGPELGEALPATEALLQDGDGLAELSDFAVSGAPCGLLIIIHSSCPFSSGMRRTWQEGFEAWSDSVGVSPRAVWASVEPIEVLIDFVDGFPLHAVALAEITGDPETALARLGAYAYPTTYLLDQHRRLRFGVVGPRLPPVAVGRTVCRGTSEPAEFS